MLFRPFEDFSARIIASRYVLIRGATTLLEMPRLVTFADFFLFFFYPFFLSLNDITPELPRGLPQSARQIERFD